MKDAHYHFGAVFPKNTYLWIFFIKKYNHCGVSSHIKSICGFRNFLNFHVSKVFVNKGPIYLAFEKNMWNDTGTKI